MYFGLSPQQNKCLNFNQPFQHNHAHTYTDTPQASENKMKFPLVENIEIGTSYVC